MTSDTHDLNLGDAQAARHAPSGRGLAALAGLAGGTTEPTARFRYDVTGDTWWWSPAMYTLHGYAPGEVVPTTAILVAHKHGEDRARTEGTLSAVLATGEPFCCRHRIVDAAGQVRTVISLGEGTCDDTGTVVCVQGYFIDVTDSLRRAIAEESHEAVERSAENRATIEQAKGLLIGVYGIDAEAAFDLLRWYSQQTNIKLRVLADGLVRHFGEREGADLSPARRVSSYLGLAETVRPPDAILHRT